MTWWMSEMNRILSLIGVVLVVGCGGPETRDLRTLREVDGLYMNPGDGQPYSGPVFSMEEGERRTGSLRDGLWDGPLEEYYENGQLREKMIWKDGEFDGSFEEYYENGQLMMKGIYKARELNGPFERYDRNGELLDRGTLKDGKECGEWFEEGEVVNYQPCPPDLEGGN
jgi:hypothetical protein